jgi:hypothetical protein
LDACGREVHSQWVPKIEERLSPSDTKPCRGDRTARQNGAPERRRPTAHPGTDHWHLVVVAVDDMVAVRPRRPLGPWTSLLKML